MPLFGKKKRGSADSTALFDGKSSGFFKVLYLGATRTSVRSESSDLALQELKAQHPTPETMKKIVLRVSIYGFQAKLWPTGEFLLDNNLVNLRSAVATGRTLVLVFKDSTWGDVAAASHTLYACYCESDAVAAEIAGNLERLLRTITAAMKEIKMAGSPMAISSADNDAEKVLADHQPAHTTDPVLYDVGKAAHYEVGNMPDVVYNQASPMRRTSFSKSVIALTDSNFVSRLADVDLAMVAFYSGNELAGWREYDRAAAHLMQRPNPVTMAKLNIATETHTAKYYTITPNNTPVFKIFQYGAPREELDYNGEINSHALVQYMRKLNGDHEETVKYQLASPKKTTEYDNVVDEQEGYIGINDPGTGSVVQLVSAIGGLTDMIESAEVLDLVPPVTIDDAEYAANTNRKGKRSKQSQAELRAIEAGEMQPNRAFITSLSQSMRVNESSQMVVLPQSLNDSYFERLL